MDLQKGVKNRLGYTHYFYQNKELNQANFNKVITDFEKTLPTLKKLGVRLAGGSGKGEPEINQIEIKFNGVEECGHEQRDLGITWPSDKAKGVNQTEKDVSESWFAGLKLNTRTCDGDCSHETFHLAQTYELESWDRIKENGKYFNFCKTAYKPYDLAVNVCLIIAKHNLGNQISVSSDGEMGDWEDAKEICQNILGYGKDFDFDKETDL